MVTMILRRGELHMMVGEYNEAAGLLQKCLQIRQRVLSPDDPDLAIPLTHLAVIYTKQREYVEGSQAVGECVPHFGKPPGAAKPSYVISP